MKNCPPDWDEIDLTFGIEMPDFTADTDESAALSVVDGIFDLPGHEPQAAPLPFRPPFGRRAATRRPGRHADMRAAEHPEPVATPRLH